ncbi:potassium transporter Trk [Marivirga tractuosa]|uniref:TrkA-N domain protein n=1 Tax=Marivirga tractuosa (strain ATCC 23168 / DSM 4126 / NBRC 15989 / NCIMB 1408 / VKM B-1430 / H-43) TaxID=643867 RepID=E4TNV0_MARTH|nr:TrkA family potassium uptake protein [Marivirga tractuosa]ADR22514.1 TrkA-N domain protein [Marivirga tractuosa DSM 4126]BDD16815.1 potassium transporter Trk [Marivirga tractuosa]
MTNRFAVIGLGQFGESIARTLSDSGAEVLAIDIDLDKVEAIKDDVAYAVALDSTDVKALKAQNIQDMDAVVVAIGENFEGLLLTTVLLLELEVERIIARAANAQQRMILEKMGIEEILSPEETVGKTVAEMLLHPNMKSFLPLPDDYEIVEINTPSRVVDQTISEIGLREKYNLNLITVKRLYDEKVEGQLQQVEHIIGVPRADTFLKETDIMIILGKSKDVNKFIEVNK